MILVLSGISVSPTGAQAKQISGLVEIEEGDFYGWQMDIVVPSQVEVEIRGQDGAQVDVLVVDKENYSRYLDGLAFDYYAGYSRLGTSNATLNFTVMSGTVYVIVDNSDHPTVLGAASPTGQARVEYWIGTSFDFHAVPDQGNLWLMYLLVGVAAFALILVIVLARVAIKMQRKI